MNRDLPELFLVLFVMSALGCLALGLRPTLNWSALRATGTRAPTALALIYLTGTLAVIMLAAKSHASGVVSSRYLVPLIPFALLLVAPGLDLIHRDPQSRRQRTMAAALRWGVLAAFLVGQVNVVGHQRGVLLARPYRQIDRALRQRFGAGTLRDFLTQRVAPGTPLLGNEAQLAGAVLDRPAVGLPGPGYTHTIWTQDEAWRVVAKYRVAYVLFFPDLFDVSAPDVANQTFFRDLKQGRVPPWLEPTFSSASVRLYQVNASGA